MPERLFVSGETRRICSVQPNGKAVPYAGASAEDKSVTAPLLRSNPFWRLYSGCDRGCQQRLNISEPVHGRSSLPYILARQIRSYPAVASN